VAKRTLGAEYTVRDCICCGDQPRPGGPYCICRDTPDWYQNIHGQLTCAVHRLEKFCVKSKGTVMARKTVGEELDQEAFKELMDSWVSLKNAPNYASFRDAMRIAFDAGMQRGISKRGCCSDSIPQRGCWCCQESHR